MSTVTGVRMQDAGLQPNGKGAPAAEVEPIGRPSDDRSRKNRPGTAGKTKSGMEALRARSTQRAKAKTKPELPDLPVAPDLPPPKSRDGKGRQFTVGTVGTGGMIFLKPVQQPALRKSPQASPIEVPELTPVSTPGEGPGFPKLPEHRDSVWNAESPVPPPVATFAATSTTAQVESPTATTAPAKQAAPKQTAPKAPVSNAPAQKAPPQKASASKAPKASLPKLTSAKLQPAKLQPKQASKSTAAKTLSTKTVPWKAPAKAPHKRSFSQSTIEGNSAHDRLDSGAMKIVIDRHKGAQTKGQGPPATDFSGLSVAIPHYRLGSPRFSARGTAFLRGSIYTVSSVTHEHGDGASVKGLGGDLDRVFAAQGLETHAVLSRRHSHTSPQPYAIQTTRGDSIYTTIAPQAYVMPAATGPISSQIFNNIATDANNPAIVKYSPINGEILAATPARLIAQITSDNFLDYELLSDFFLTVRSYMSTHDLLAYLLARFEWAINRFDDNGRVIRVRTFAALRHWILNYFSYDFVVDYELRVQLCDRLNALTSVVRARAEYGASDMKVIADLKKCWNGRCALYWGTDSFPVEGAQDTDIQPGGKPENRDSWLAHQNQLRFAPVTGIPPQLALSPAQLTAGTPNIANWYTTVMEQSTAYMRTHARQASTGTSQSLPISPTTEGSVPVLSCSIPGRSFRRALPYARALGLHPIPTNAHGHPLGSVAASALASGQVRVVARGRQGSIEDAGTAQRALSSEAPEVVDDTSQSSFHQNLLRGHGIAPSSPLVIAITSTPGSETPPRNNEQARKSGGNNPAVKSLLGNIRRALSSRYTPPSQVMNGATPHSSAPTPPMGKTVQVPFNVLYQASASGQLEHFRGSRRIDMLSKETFDAYQRAVNESIDPVDEVGEHNIGVALGNESQEPSPFGFDANRPSYGFHNQLILPEVPGRKNSAVTDGSQSIMIMDDTGSSTAPHPVIPTINTNVGSENGDSQETPKASSSNQVLSAPEPRKLNAHGHLAEPFVFPPPPLGGGATTQFQPIAPPIRNTGTTQTSSISLRRYASFQSSLSKTAPELSIDTSGKKADHTDPSTLAPGRVLRRRPGGDLRAHKNVHDMEIPTRPKSAGSVTTYSESVRESAFVERARGTFDLSRPMNRQIPAAEATAAGAGRVSMVKTHSSLPEKRRPSFEAAVAEFAQIPDDDEGGIEATLLKLEGKYKSPLQSPVETRHPPARPSAPEPPPTPEDDNAPAAAPAAAAGQKAADGAEAEAVTASAREQVTSDQYAPSEASYNSIPLLERSADDGPAEMDGAPASHSAPTLPLTAENLDGPMSQRRLRHGSYAPTATTDSFLLEEDDEFLSDLSSELSADTAEPTGAGGDDDNEDDLITPVREHPPSHPVADYSHMPLDQRKPSPRDASPGAPTGDAAQSKFVQPDPSQPKHLPFILGFEAEIVAQQLTMLEQEAIREVDWRDLVDMRWQSAATTTTNWVEYLAHQDPIGIDLATARFNIMVKWALSEIVLTEDVDERAQTVIKYIHIAKHARQLHNYATLMQLTIALTSPDCTRLGRTWNKVPEADKEILTDLEMIVSPKKNFAALRAEIEKVHADAGCIPVLALYTHDLIYNAQKPAQIPGALSGGEPLVNFERFRSTAVIVKSLLRLIDASTRYHYQPIIGLIDRCLWMAALPDEMIAYKSKQLEFT